MKMGLQRCTRLSSTPSSSPRSADIRIALSRRAGLYIYHIDVKYRRNIALIYIYIYIYPKSKSGTA